MPRALALSVRSESLICNSNEFSRGHTVIPVIFHPSPSIDVRNGILRDTLESTESPKRSPFFEIYKESEEMYVQQTNMKESNEQNNGADNKNRFWLSRRRTTVVFILLIRTVFGAAVMVVVGRRVSWRTLVMIRESVELAPIDIYSSWRERVSCTIHRRRCSASRRCEQQLEFVFFSDVYFSRACCAVVVIPIVRSHHYYINIYAYFFE